MWRPKLALHLHPPTDELSTETKLNQTSNRPVPGPSHWFRRPKDNIHISYTVNPTSRAVHMLSVEAETWRPFQRAVRTPGGRHAHARTLFVAASEFGSSRFSSVWPRGADMLLLVLVAELSIPTTTKKGNATKNPI